MQVMAFKVTLKTPEGDQELEVAGARPPSLRSWKHQ